MLTGTMPVAPTVFHDDESLDLAGQRRVYDFLIDAGSDAICVLANFSEQFSLDDDERDIVMRDALEHIGGRVPVAVTTSHFSARVTAARSRRAAELGAELVMIMAPSFGTSLRPSDDAVLEYFRRVSDGLEADIMIQDAPLSATPLSVDLLARIAREVPRVRYAKIEVPRAAQKIAALASRAGDDLPGLFDGEEGVTLIPDFDAGASGAMCSALAPDLVGRAVAAHLRGDRDEAVREWESALPLLQFENRQCGPLAAKIALAAGGVIGSPAGRAPLDPVAPAVATALVDLARRRDALVLSWG
jgi:2-keto-3-deoxy-L-arabinonate dehydratase